MVSNRAVLPIPAGPSTIATATTCDGIIDCPSECSEGHFPFDQRRGAHGAPHNEYYECTQGAVPGKRLIGHDRFPCNSTIGVKPQLART
jgi:hypothetical protein